MLEKMLLQIILGELYARLSSLKNIVRRDAQFPNVPNKIKVAVGMRRTGKSYFLYQKILDLLQEGVEKTTILYINFEDDRFLPLNQKKLAALVEAFYSLYPENHEKKCYLFLDEIQNIEDWPLVIRRLHDTKNVEIFLTGSSAKLLSKEIASNLRGRSLAVEIWPYSFPEFLRAKETKINLELYDKKTQDLLSHFFHLYLSEGGFPEVTHYTTPIRQQTLQNYLDVLIYRDIIERHSIKNPAIIKYMILSMINNVGKPFTINKFYNDLKSQGYAASKDMLYEYAAHIEDAYLAFPITLHNKSIRKVQTNPKKIYAIDPGMIRSLTLDYENDLGRLFENIIFLDLMRLGCQVNYYLTQERYEIDFLVQPPRGPKKIFQVAWNDQDIKTLEREQRALKAAGKETGIKGELITLDSYLRYGINI